MRCPTRTRWMLAALVVMALSTACGGGGGGGGGPTTPPPPPPGIRFTPSGSPSTNSLYLTEGAQTNVNRLFLEVRVNDVDELYGVAFDLVYPSQLLAFARAKEGNFFKGTTSLQAVEKALGRVIVGHTNLGANEPESGSGLLMTLEFTPINNGSGAMSFDKEQAFTRGSLPMTIDFIAGNVSVQR